MQFLKYIQFSTREVFLKQMLFISRRWTWENAYMQVLSWRLLYKRCLSLSSC